MQKNRKKKTTKTRRKESFKLLKQKLSDPSKNFDTEVNTNTNPLNKTRFNKTKGKCIKFDSVTYYLIQLAITKTRLFA